MDNMKMMSKQRKKRINSLTRALFLIGIGFVMVYPVVFMLSTAFKSIFDVYDPTVVWLPKYFSLQPLSLAGQVLNYWDSIKTTIGITLPSVVLQVATALLAGYGFARFEFKENKLLFGLLIFTIIVPPQAYIMPLYVSFGRFDYFGIGSLIGQITGKPLTTNLLNTNTPFYLQAVLGAGIRSGLYIFIIRQFFINIPNELEEAAMIDGCGPLKTFLRIMLPNAVPLIATISVFSIVWYWNDFVFSSIFFTDKFPISVNLTFLNSLLSTSNLTGGLSSQELVFLKEPILAAGALITILPLIILYIFAQRYFTEGIERSGIVG